MVGIVRLYVEPRSAVPANHVPIDYSPVVDLLPEDVPAQRRLLRKAGFDVIAVPL